MAKRKPTFHSPLDMRLNFIIVLALTFLLILFVGAAMSSTAIRTRAFLTCGPAPTIPTTPCASGWKAQRDNNGCSVFSCATLFNPPEETE